MCTKTLLCVGLVMAGCGGGGGSGDDGDMRIDASSEPGGPVIASLATNRASITDGEVITFTAIVTDPDGLDDIAGGTLTLAGAANPLGAFVQQAGGTYTIDVTWAQIASARPIEFTSDETRTFHAEFVDNTSRRGTRDAALLLTCGGNAACASACTDQQENSSHCGACGRACRTAGESGGCSSGECLPALTECIGTTALPTCDAVCQAMGESCTSCDGVPALYYRSRNDCAAHIPAGPGLSCDEEIRTDTGPQLRCCCTSTP